MELTIQNERSPYDGYMYSYPHKSAYRDLHQRRLKDVWAAEPRPSLFAYVHIPFCEMRCGFCNLFTIARPPESLPGLYMDRLVDQIHRTVAVLDDAKEFVRLSVGGGTPTLLNPQQLTRLFDTLQSNGIDAAKLPTSIETSPATATPDRLELLADRGVTRISIGIQTFDDAESKRLARPQSAAAAHQAVTTIANSKIPEFNLDLIYGIEGQTQVSFQRSIDQTLEYSPSEIYLYPLYVRPLTGLGQTQRAWDDQRQALYRHGRDQLLASGYRQLSMRVFRRASDPVDVPDYSCQDDGMIGFGVGARSYTSTLHYSSRFAVSRPAVAGVVDAYIDAPADADTTVDYGFELNADEQHRRYAIKLLLRTSGMDLVGFSERFGINVFQALPLLSSFVEAGWLEQVDTTLRPTADGLAMADLMGPMLISPATRSLGETFELL